MLIFLLFVRSKPELRIGVKMPLFILSWCTDFGNICIELFVLSWWTDFSEICIDQHEITWFLQGRVRLDGIIPPPHMSVFHFTQRKVQAFAILPSGCPTKSEMYVIHYVTLLRRLSSKSWLILSACGVIFLRELYIMITRYQKKLDLVDTRWPAPPSPQFFFLWIQSRLIQFTIIQLFYCLSVVCFSVYIVIWQPEIFL